MFFAASKALDPRLWVGALSALGLMARRRLLLATSLGAVAAALAGCAYSPTVADLLLRWLGGTAGNTVRPEARYDAAIILGGNEARLAPAAQLVRSGRARFLLYSGALGPGESRRMAAKLVQLGAPEDTIVLEPRSRDTHENAVASARIMAARGWHSVVVVTNAIHVKRALGCFRRLGLEPDFLPIEDRALLARPTSVPWPSDQAFQRNCALLHELVGWLVYRAVGYAA